MSSRRLEAGELELGGGLEVLLAAALEAMPAGGRLEVLTRSRSTALELPSWARAAGHEAVSERAVPGGSFAVEIERGPFARVHADALPERGPRPQLRGTELHTADLRLPGVVRAQADAAAGFTPIGAIAERGAPSF